jgi:hypothetical protein
MATRLLPRLPQPYSFPEAVAWLVNNALGPARRHRRLTGFIPRRIRLAEVETTLRIGFVGDVMPLRGRGLAPGPRLRSWLGDLDYLVANLEGVVLPGPAPWRLFAQAHPLATLDGLADLVPPGQIVLCCANNHAADFGREALLESRRRLEARGFQVLGERHAPSLRLGPVNLACGTRWSNRRCDYTARLEDHAGHHDPSAPLNVLYPHWGYEMQLYPRPEQVTLARSLLQTWDAVIGHHPHCPQPVAVHEVDGVARPVAYSLGDFTFGWNLRRYLYGILLVMHVGRDRTGRFRVGELRWTFTRLQHRGGDRAALEVADDCPYFPAESASASQPAGPREGPRCIGRGF